MIGNIIVLTIIGILVILAIFSIKKNGINKCGGCSNDCKSCTKVKELEKYLRDIKKDID